MKWKSIRFENIQSWEEGFLELNNKGLTVLEAKSETGKSVFIKCIRLGLFFESYDKKTRLAIIRNYPKNKFGTFIIELEDGTKVGFRYGETKVVCVVIYPDNTNEVISRSNISKVAKLLNLFIVKDSVRVLNILDNETPMLYDTTDMEYNTNIMSLYLDHEDLRTRKKNCEDFLNRIRTAEARTKNLYDNYLMDYERVNVNYDLEVVNYSYKKAEKANKILNILELMQEEMKSLSCYYFKNTCNMDNLDSIFSYLNYVKILNFEVKHLMEILNMKKMVCDNSYICNIEDTRQKLNYYKELYKNIILLEETFNIKKIINLKEIEIKRNKIENVKKINGMLGFLFNSIVDAEKTEKSYKDSQEAINIFKRKNKTCPLCGQLWKDDQY